MKYFSGYRNSVQDKLDSFGAFLVKWRWYVTAIIFVITIFFEIYEHRPFHLRELYGPLLWETLLFGLATPLLMAIGLSLYNIQSQLSQAVSQLNLEQIIQVELSRARDWDEMAVTLLQIPRAFFPVSSGILTIKNKDTGKYEIKSEWSADSACPIQDLVSDIEFDDFICQENSSLHPKIVWQKPGVTGAYFIRFARDQQCFGWMQFCPESKISLNPDQIRQLESIVPAMSLAIENFMLRDFSESKSKVILSERKRLARHLHDTLAHNLAYIRLKTDQFLSDGSVPKSDALYGELERIRDIANQSYEQIRTSLADLREEPGLALIPRIREVILEVNSRAQIEVELTNHGEERPLPSLFVRQILMNIREALHNAEIHARAKKVRIELNWQDTTLEIQICDDGQGFDPQQVENNGNGYGIRMMKEVAEELDGQVVFASQTNQGTMITFRFPLQYS